MIRLASVLWILAMSSPFAIAQPFSSDPPWPNRPIRYIVSFPAGSSADIIARIVGQKLSERLGQPIVVDNRAGASGNIATDALARSAPDGYTMGLATTTTHALAVSLNSKLPFDPIKDFTPVSMIGNSPYVLATYPGLPSRNLQEVIVLAKAKPHSLNYASAGAASLGHLAGALFEKLAHVELTHVPYRTSAQSVLDLTEGRIEMQFGQISTALPYIKDGKMRALAVTGAARLDALPEVPTMAEAGVPGYEVSLWMAMVMPSATPANVVSKLNREMTAILNSVEGKAPLIAQSFLPRSRTPEELGAHMRDEIEKWRALIATAGIRAD